MQRIEDHLDRAVFLTQSIKRKMSKDREWSPHHILRELSDTLDTIVSHLQEQRNRDRDREEINRGMDN